MTTRELCDVITTRELCDVMTTRELCDQCQVEPGTAVKMSLTSEEQNVIQLDLEYFYLNTDVTLPGPVRTVRIR